MGIERAIRALECVSGDGSAREVQLDAEVELMGRGYMVQREYRVLDRGDGRGGRIDLMASDSEDSIAVEIDYLGLRKKSLFKLRAFPGRRILVLRHAPRGRWPDPPRGIDAVIGLGGPAIRPPRFPGMGSVQL